MAKFKIGDVCIVQGLIYYPEMNGMEVVIERITPPNTPALRRHSFELIVSSEELYFCTGVIGGYYGKNLRLKKFPGEEKVMKLFTEVIKRDVVPA